ncbi:MAG: PDZ domain-containing protein [Pyrinomonadaceae bacterium]
MEPITPETTARFSLSNAKGLVVMDVDSSGPASAAGIKVGDLIEEINGLPVRALADVGTALAKTNSGRANMRIKRGGKSLSIDLQPRDVNDRRAKFLE